MHLDRSLLLSIGLGVILAACLGAAGMRQNVLANAYRNSSSSSILEPKLPQDLVCSLPPPSREPFCGSTGNSLTATVSGGVLPYTFFWGVSGDGKLTGGQDTQTITFDIGTSGVTIALTVTDAVGVTAECSAIVICVPPPPPPEFCTLGQGFYGSGRGGFNGNSTFAVEQALLSTGDLVVGKPGRSLTIQLSAAACLVQRLPAIGTPRELPLSLGNATLNSASCQTFPASLPTTSTGKLYNVLLGQAIVLSLNTHLSAGLAELGICNTMATQSSFPGADRLFGTGDDIRSPGPDGALGTSDDPIITVKIPVSVTTALSALGIPRTVGGLLELANRALAGESTGGASLGDVNAAVTAINTGFDGCRFLLSCSTYQ